MTNVSWIDLVILAFASFRLTHLIVFDDIASFLRKPFLTVTTQTDDNGMVTQVVEIKGSGIRYWIGSMLSCHWCTGIWSSAAIVAVYWFLPSAFPLLLLLAVAGVAAMIESRLLP